MRKLFVSLSLLLWCACALAQTPAIRFHQSNHELGLPQPGSTSVERKYVVQAIAGGIALFDCDNDGNLDLAVINEPTLEEYRQNGGVPMLTLYKQEPGPKFRDVTEKAGLSRIGWGMGISIADYDNDGLLDIFVSGFGGNALYHNLGGCQFVDVTDKAGVNRQGFNTGATWGDYDRDGKVDLFVARYSHVDIAALEPIRTNYKGLRVEAPWGTPGESDLLFHNAGNGRFEEVGTAAGVNDPSGRIGLGAVWADLDGDGWPDLYVANDSQPNFYYRNQHNGKFLETALLSGNALGGDGKALASMGVAVQDYDNDLRQDVAITTYAYEPIELHHNDSDSGFSDHAFSAHTGEGSFRWVKWGIGFEDFDNNGWPDLMIACGHTYTAIDSMPGEPGFREPMILFRNANGLFEDVSNSSGLNAGPLQSRRGMALGDINNDGKIDVVVFNQSNAPSVFLNVTESSNHWVTFKLEGTKSNRAAIGAKLTIQTAAGKQMKEVLSGGSYLSQNDLRLHFGLGTSAQIETVTITWPSGTQEEFHMLRADRFYTFVEGSGIKAPAEVTTSRKP